VGQLLHDISFWKKLGPIPKLESDNLADVNFGEVSVFNCSAEPVVTDVDKPGDGSHRAGRSEVLDGFIRQSEYIEDVLKLLTASRGRGGSHDDSRYLGNYFC
jgi:hypothetical protein